jgi:hypothetical protein
MAVKRPVKWPQGPEGLASAEGALAGRAPDKHLKSARCSGGIPERLHAVLGRGRGPAARLLPQPRHRQDDAAAAAAGAGGRGRGHARADVRGRAPQQHRRPRGRCTSRCAPIATTRISTAISTSPRRCTRCSTAWTHSCAPCIPASTPATAPAGGSPMSSTSASAAPTWASRWPSSALANYAVPGVRGALRVEHRRRGPGRRAGRRSSRHDAVRDLLQDLHHARDAHQCQAAREWFVIAAGRRGRAHAFRRRVHQPRGHGRLRHLADQPLRLLGLRRRALFAVVRRRAVDRAGHRHGPFPRAAGRRLGPWTGISATRRPRPTCRCCWAC